MRLLSHQSPDIDDAFLLHAYELAEEGRGRVSPNPVVGCVVVRDGNIVGRGAHVQYGGAHAEAVALADAGDAAAGATAYVTLEPCNHHGKTSPCTDALVRAGVSRVVIGMADPNDELVGGGADALASAGVDVDFFHDPAPFVDQNEPWLHFLKFGRPWVRVKTALTLDGRTALRHGEGSRISGAETDALTMRLRAASDAVLVGARTAEVDNPALTVRDLTGELADTQPMRVVLGRNAVPSADLLTDGKGKSVALVLKEWAESPDSGVEVLGYDGSKGIIGAFETLGALGITHCLVEAGGGLVTALWERNLIDELVLYQAGGMAGSDAPSIYYPQHKESASTLDRRMAITEVGIVGSDAVTVWRRSTELDG